MSTARTKILGRSAAALLLLTVLRCPAVGAPHGCGHPSCDGGHPLRVNPLRSLAPLPKVHYSWAIYPPFLDNATVADGAVVDYVRITGALTPTDQLKTAHEAITAVSICSKASAMEGCLKVRDADGSTRCRQATITLSMSCLPGDCLAHAGTAAFATCAADGARALRATLTAAQHALAAANAALRANVSVGAVTYDCESLIWDTDTPPASLAALTTINELTYNTTRLVFPQRSETRVLLYGFGGVSWMPTVPHPSPADNPHCDRACRACNTTWHRAGGGGAAPLPLGWSIPSAYYTYRERFLTSVPYSPALYAVAEPELMRRQFSLTAQMARSSGAGEVVPYIGLGWGYRRAAVVNDSGPVSRSAPYTGGYVSDEVDYQYDEGACLPTHIIIIRQPPVTSAYHRILRVAVPLHTRRDKWAPFS